MKKNFAILSFSFALLALCGCGSDVKTNRSPLPEIKANGGDFYILNQVGLNSSKGEVSGTGSLLFKRPLKGVQSRNNFDLRFALSDGGSLALVANADNQLKNGVTVRFTRSGRNLEVQTAGSNGNSTNISELFSTVSLHGTLADITISTDVHNDHGHLVFWVNNKELAHEEHVDANGKGALWGVELKNAKLIKAVAAGPRDKHDD